MQKQVEQVKDEQIQLELHLMEDLIIGIDEKMERLTFEKDYCWMQLKIQGKSINLISTNIGDGIWRKVG